MNRTATKSSIPKEWEVKKLSDYVNDGTIELGRGNVISKKDIISNPGTNPIYSSSVQHGGLFGTYAGYMFDEELITWSIDGGGNFFYRPKHKFSVTNVSGILKVDRKKFDYRFLAYLLVWEHRNLRFDYQTKAHPSVIRELYYIARPPLWEQEKIAEILSSIDQEIAKVEEIISTSRKLKQGLLKNLFKSNNTALLDTIANRGSGHTPNKQHSEYWNGGIKWVSLSDSQKLDNRYIFETDKEISDLGIENSSAVLHTKDTVIVCRDAGIGRVAILGSDNMAVSQHFIAWKCGKDLDFKYLYYWLQSQKNVLERIATGTTIKTIGLSFFKNMRIPIFHIDEQRKIGDFLWNIDDKILVNQKIRAKLLYLKKGVNAGSVERVEARMNNNLNQDLYLRFGLHLNLAKIEEGCKKYLKTEIVDALKPIISPNLYQDKTKLWDIQSAVLDEVCRQLFLDVDDWYGTDHSSGLERMINSEISDSFHGSFNEYLLRLQILLNIVTQHNFVRHELDQLAIRIEKYFNDFPILGITIKIYKRKAPQIIPTTSKKFESEIKNTLGLLETDQKYEHVLSHFENGLKEFLTAKTQSDYKDVIEDLYTACDELVKAVTGHNGKGFKHISDRTEAVALSLNGHQKELFKNLRNWMDEIKHGTIKDFDRNDTEMIISMIGSLIRLVILNRQ